MQNQYIKKLKFQKAEKAEKAEWLVKRQNRAEQDFKRQKTAEFAAKSLKTLKIEIFFQNFNVQKSLNAALNCSHTCTAFRIFKRGFKAYKTFITCFIKYLLN